MPETVEVEREYLDGRVQVVRFGKGKWTPKWGVLVDGEEVKRYDYIRLRTHPRYQHMIAHGKADAYARGLADAAEVLA